MTAISSRVGQVRGRKLLPELGTLNCRASQTFYPGALVAHRLGSNLAEAIDPANPRTDLVIVGTATHYVATTTSADGSGNALDADGNILTVMYETGLLKFFDTGAGANQITDVNGRGKPAYAYDNNTLYLTDNNGTLSFAGIVHSVDADEGVRLMIFPEGGGLTEIFGAGNATPGATADDTVRAVATSFPAGTFSGGVLTLTATGAFSTAQDGVTLAVGDKFILPAGTIGSLTVSAADSGVYEVKSLGAVGVSATFARTAKWAHGAIITPETEIRVGGEGTLFRGSRWYADPATATKVVGTDDPVLYPRSVTQTVALASSAATITNVPIKSATKSNVIASLAAVGGTTTNTIGWGIIVAPTPGGIGTATTTVNAIASGGTKNGTADTSSLIVTITN